MGCLCCGPANAQSVSMNGSMGSKALLVIDGQLRTMSPGTTSSGVTLVSVGTNEAVVEMSGRRVVLAVGASPVNLGSLDKRAGGGTQIVLNAGSGGHFVTGGNINGRAVQFVVDTGATLITISKSNADRIGLDYTKGRQTFSQTANGVIPAVVLSLGSVRVGDIEIYNVEAVVIPAQLDVVLLGNSFLSRFQMKRDNDQMTLTRRY